MKSDLPKVLHPVLDRPMLSYVFDACRAAGVQTIYAVIGHGADTVKAAFADARDVVWVVQPEQRGTGHAVLCCREHLRDFQGQTLILCGDGPLIRGETLATLMDTHVREQAAVTLATVQLDDPTGYGRIIRDANGAVQGIVEHNDCSPEQRAVHEVNPSYYCFDNTILFEALAQVTDDNAKGEYYLTDALHIAIDHGYTVATVTGIAPEEALSINSTEQLEHVSGIMAERVARKVV
jgi:bifunctional UDP-N-acetylglucosamine pyrophosphorylase/glucosamine-1-phosphate N-acetyltransferase